MIKNGNEYIASLRDRRAVLVDGSPIEDVTTPAAYRRAIASSGRLRFFRRRPRMQT